MSQIETFRYDDEIVRKFLLATIVWGVVGFCAGNVMMMSVSLYTGYFSGIGKEYELLFEIVSGLLRLRAVFYSAIPFWQGARRA